MQNYYYVNKNSQSTGEHEVHKTGCGYMPSENNKIYLGSFSNCQSALIAAKNKGYYNVDGCAHCCSACHKK